MLEDLYITVPGLPPSHEVDDYIARRYWAERPPRSHRDQRTLPVGYVLTLLLGLLLILASSGFLLLWGNF